MFYFSLLHLFLQSNVRALLESIIDSWSDRLLFFTGLFSDTAWVSLHVSFFLFMFNDFSAHSCFNLTPWSILNTALQFSLKIFYLVFCFVFCLVFNLFSFVLLCLFSFVLHCFCFVKVLSPLLFNITINVCLGIWHFKFCLNVSLGLHYLFGKRHNFFFSIQFVETTSKEITNITFNFLLWHLFYNLCFHSTLKLN